MSGYKKDKVKTYMKRKKQYLKEEKSLAVSVLNSKVSGGFINFIGLRICFRIA